MSKRRGLKINGDKVKVMMVGEENPWGEIMLDGEQLVEVPRLNI